jgi:hypothetical protein
VGGETVLGAIDLSNGQRQQFTLAGRELTLDERTSTSDVSLEGSRRVRQQVEEVAVGRQFRLE